MQMKRFIIDVVRLINCAARYSLNYLLFIVLFTYVGGHSVPMEIEIRIRVFFVNFLEVASI